MIEARRDYDMLSHLHIITQYNTICVTYSIPIANQRSNILDTNALFATPSPPPKSKAMTY